MFSDTEKSLQIGEGRTRIVENNPSPHQARRQKKLSSYSNVIGVRLAKLHLGHRGIFKKNFRESVSNSHGLLEKPAESS